MKPQLLFLFIILVFLPYSAKAQLDDIPGSNKTIRTAGSSLLIPADARSSGMGAIGIAAATPQEAIFWNPAIIPFSEKTGGFTMQLMPWYTALGIKGIYRYAFGGFYRINADQELPIVLGLSVRNVTLRGLDRLTLGGTHTPRYELSIAGSASAKITEFLAWGAVIRYMDSRFSIQNSISPMQTLMGDLALNFQKDIQLCGKALDFSAALVLANLGPKVSYSPFVDDEFLPTNVAIGYSLAMDISDDHQITISQDIRKLLVPSVGGPQGLSAFAGIFSSSFDSQDGFRGELSEINTGIGIEYSFRNMLSLRSGYTWTHPDQGKRRLFTVGLGAKLKDLSVDASFWIPTEINNPFQNTWSMGVGWSL